MSPLRKSREFSLDRQMVFGDRAGAPDQPNPLWKHAFSARTAVAQPTPHDGAEGDAPAESETEQ